jgi:hypothetical protein
LRLLKNVESNKENDLGPKNVLPVVKTQMSKKSYQVRENKGLFYNIVMMILKQYTHFEIVEKGS